MELSQYQSAILDAVEARFFSPEWEGKQIKGLLIEALAGTGKSFILSQVCRLLHEKGVSSECVRLVVFGRKNKADLASKLAQISPEWEKSVSTLHSLSYSVLRDALDKPAKAFRIDAYKYRQIARQMGFVADGDQPGLLAEIKSIEADSDFLDLLEKMRLYCCDLDRSTHSLSEDVRLIARTHGLEIHAHEEVAIAAKKCLDFGLSEALKNLWIDFTDQSWLLWQCRNQPEFQSAFRKWQKQLSLICVDEAQDTDQLQIEVIDLLRDPAQCFIMPVGDRWQAVYGFRGCLADGLDRMASRFSCDRLPLPVNYRCGKIHLKLVNFLYPQIGIKYHEAAPEGDIRLIKSQDFLKIFEKHGDKNYLGICRKNAPLVSFAITLLVAGLPAKIKDKSLGAKLVSQVEQICKKARKKYSVESFGETVNQYLLFERSRLLKYPDAEKRLEDLDDRVASIMALFDAYSPESIKGWQAVVDKIFDESGTAPINLFTIHSGKGGEGEIAFVLEPEIMPLRWKGQSEAELQQEQNLLYVALTRPLAKGEDTGILYLVSKDKKPSWFSDDWYDFGNRKDAEIISEIAFNAELEALKGKFSASYYEACKALQEIEIRGLHYPQSFSDFCSEIGLDDSKISQMLRFAEQCDRTFAIA